MTEVAALVVRLEATTAKFDRITKRSADLFRRQMGIIERTSRRTDNRIAQFGSRFGAGLVARLAIVSTAMLAVRKAIIDTVESGDKLRSLEGRFKALTGSAERAGVLIGAAFKIVQETGGSFDAAVGGLTRFTIAAEAIGATDQEVTQLTQNLLKLGAIGGGSAQEVRSGIIQLGQSLSKGRADGDELRSVMENLPLVARVIAKEFGVSVGQLKKLGEAGELTSRRIFDAIINATEETDRQFAELPQTVERAANKMASSWVRFTAALNKSVGASERLQRALETLGGLTDQATRFLGNAEARRQLQLTDQLIRLRAEKAEVPGQDTELGKAAAAIIQTEIDAAVAEYEGILARQREEFLKKHPVVSTGGLDPRRRERGLQAARGVQTLPSGFLPPPAPLGLGGTDRRPLAKATGGGSARTEQEAAQFLDSLREQIDAQREALELLELEGSETDNLITARGRLIAANQRARHETELANLAKREDVTVSEEQRLEAIAGIVALEQQAIAIAELEQAILDKADADRDAEQAAENHRRAIEQIGNAITSAIQQADSFADALKNVAIQLANIALQGFTGSGPLGSVLGNIIPGLAAGIGGSSSGGLVSGLDVPVSAKGNIFSGGNVVPFARGGVVNGPRVFPMANGIGLMGEAGPEAIMPLKRGSGGRLGVEGGGRATTVIVNNNTQEQATTQSRRGPDGSELVEIVIGEVRDDLGKGGFDSTLKGRFGLGPQRVRR